MKFDGVFCPRYGVVWWPCGVGRDDRLRVVCTACNEAPSLDCFCCCCCYCCCLLVSVIVLVKMELTMLMMFADFVLTAVACVPRMERTDLTL